jgi:aspartyl-tRNA(Asn)/glutamyl-tRNA(Gln) amidotransferase subunit C
VNISKEEVNHVALLGRLALSAEEHEAYTRQLDEILRYIEKLNELDTSAVEPMVHLLPIVNVLRDDVVQPSLDLNQVSQNAPDWFDGQFRVPKIV